MIKATKQEKDIALEILHSAFFNVLIPNSINFTIKNDHKRHERLMALMDYQFKMSMKYGEVFISDDKNGCVLYIDKIYPSLDKVSWEIKLLFKCIGIENTYKTLKKRIYLKTPTFLTFDKLKEFINYHMVKYLNIIGSLLKSVIFNAIFV